MRTDAEYEEAMRWMAWGLNTYQAARVTELPRGTISNWSYGTRSDRRASNLCPRCGSDELSEPVYAYLLGLYLGDGSVTQVRGKTVYRLVITQNVRYLGLIAECAPAVDSFVRPDGPDAGFVERSGCIDVVSFWRHWPCVFPQHGPGRKHERAIRLERWQRAIVQTHPQGLIRGLIHSDGCRYLNTVGKDRRPGGYRYPSYAFTNLSSDIRKIFCMACDQLHIRYRSSGRNIRISRRPDVEKLESFIGPKA